MGDPKIKPKIQVHPPAQTHGKANAPPDSTGIPVIRGYFKGSPFRLVIIDPKENDIWVHISPQKKDGNFIRQTLKDVNAQYRNTLDLIANATFLNVEKKADGQPLGFVKGREKIWVPTTVSYKGKPVSLLNRWFFAIKKDGTLVIGQKSAEELRKENFLVVIGGGGPLIKDGKIIVSEESLKSAGVSEGTHQWKKKRQRTAIGIKDGKFVIVIFGYQDGENARNSGVTLKDLAVFMRKYGIKNAIFLDSGSSTAMYIRGKKSQSLSPAELTTFICVRKKPENKAVAKKQEKIKSLSEIFRQLGKSVIDDEDK